MGEPLQEISMSRLREILASEGLVTAGAAPGTLGVWMPAQKDSWPAGRYTNWYMAARDPYGSLIIGAITYNAGTGTPGWLWQIYMKDWKAFVVGKHDKLLAKDFRPYEKGFVKTDDMKFGDNLKRDVEKKMLDMGAQLKGHISIDTSQPPPAAEAMVKALRGIPGIKFSSPSKHGQTAHYVLEDTTNGQAHKQLQQLLSRAGFSGFSRGKFMGSGETGVSAVYEQGGRIFATVRTSTTMGVPETRVSVEAEWSVAELNGK